MQNNTRFHSRCFTYRTVDFFELAESNRKLFYSTSLFSSIKERILGFSENQDTPFHWKEFPLRIYSWVGQISREESIHYNACAIWYAIIFGKIIIPRPATTYYPTHYPNGIVGIL